MSPNRLVALSRIGSVGGGMVVGDVNVTICVSEVTLAESET